MLNWKPYSSHFGSNFLKKNLCQQKNEWCMFSVLLTFYMIDGKVCAACGWNSWSSVGWRDNAAPLLLAQSHSLGEKSKGYWQRRWHVLWVKIKHNDRTHSMHPDMFVGVLQTQQVWRVRSQYELHRMIRPHATFNSARMWKCPGINTKYYAPQTCVINRYILRPFGFDLKRQVVRTVS